MIFKYCWWAIVVAWCVLFVALMVVRDTAVQEKNIVAEEIVDTERLNKLQDEIVQLKNEKWRIDTEMKDLISVMKRVEYTKAHVNRLYSLHQSALLIDECLTELNSHKS